MVVAEQIEKIGRVARIDDRKLGEAELGGVFRHESMGHGVERAAPHPPRSFTIRAQQGGARQHVVGRATREGEQQDALGRGAPLQQVGDAARQGAGLPGAGSRENDQRLFAMRHRRQLGVIQPGIPPRIEHTVDCKAVSSLSRTPEATPGASQGYKYSISR